MRLSEICNKLKAKIPQYTNDFSGTVLDCTISKSSGTNIVTVTLSDHGLTKDDYFTLSDFDVANEIPALSDAIINYQHQVSSVIDENNFGFEILTGVSTFSDIAGKLHKEIRIFVSMGVDASINAYTDTTKLTLALIDLPASISRDRRVKTDAIQTTSVRNSNNLYLISNIACLLFIPLKDQTVGAEAVDKQREILKIMLKSISGVQLDSDFEESKTTQLSMESSATQLVGNSTYVHNYQFQVQETIAQSDQNGDSFDYDARLDEIAVSDPQT